MDSMPEDRRARLEALEGWAWNTQEAAWEGGFKALEGYIQEHGDALVPQSFRTVEGFRLGSWVTTQRAKMDSMPEDRRERLEALNGWHWDPRSADWETGFKALEGYVQENGDALVPQIFRTVEGFSLGRWVAKQRGTRDSMPVDRRARLEALEGWAWNTLEAAWEGGFKALEGYIQEHGDALVQQSFKTVEGFSLGRWVAKQRGTRDSMPVDRKARLEALEGWAWVVKNV